MRTSRDDMATCREVGRVLQAYLDSEVDDVMAHRVARHLEACRRCGLEAHVYQAVKDALARRRSRTVDVDAVERLRTFAADLAGEDPGAARI